MPGAGSAALWILLLLSTTLFNNLRAEGGRHMTGVELLNIRYHTGRSVLKDIWNNDYKSLVKRIEPSILRSRKRGKRSGVKLRHEQCNYRVPLPAILLSNVRSMLPKMDELSALLSSSYMRNLAQVICLTESWLTSNISESQTELDGYHQFRNDRQDSTGKSKGGGVLVYISRSWSNNNWLIHKHSASDLEMMSILSRPRWLPRELQSIITVSCYAPCTGTNQRKATTLDTAYTITSHVNDLEKKYPSAVIYVMGDFNQVKVTHPKCLQVLQKTSSSWKFRP